MVFDDKSAKEVKAMCSGPSFSMINVGDVNYNIDQLNKMEIGLYSLRSAHTDELRRIEAEEARKNPIGMSEMP